ncbi:MAG: putative inorganic carbon transporter subunit DabA [Vicinamibacterales bacterium]
MSGHGAVHEHADPVTRALARASGILPDQGPIGVFVHHNTLHAFQHLPFHEGVCAGASALRARPYLSLQEFRDAWRGSRIADDDLCTEIDLVLGASRAEPVVGQLTRAGLWHTLLVTDCDVDDAAGLAFNLELGTAPQAEDRPLWEACLSRVGRGPRPA